MKLDELLEDKYKVFILDGDIIRQGLNKDLGFSHEARAENIRRISEVSKLFAMAGQICFVAFISPYQNDRDFARKIHVEAGIPFYECYVSAPLEVCESRDVKGLYKKARAGIIPNFTGVSDPYEAPAHPDLDVKTHEQSLDESVHHVMERMVVDDLLHDNRKPRVAQCLYEKPSEEEKKEYDALKSIEIDLEQVEYL